jgi:hypothetical protein
MLFDTGPLLDDEACGAFDDVAAAVCGLFSFVFAVTSSLHFCRKLSSSASVESMMEVADIARD